VKRFLCISLLLLCLTAMVGCERGNTFSDSPASFFYLRREFSYGKEDAVITQEERDVSGHREDMDYLLLLYIQGPADQNLISPFPITTQIDSLVMDGSSLYVTLRSNGLHFQSDLHKTLAYICLAKTCMALNTTLDTIYIQTDEDVSNQVPPVSITKDSMELWDTTNAATAA